MFFCNWLKEISLSESQIRKLFCRLKPNLWKRREGLSQTLYLSNGCGEKILVFVSQFALWDDMDCSALGGD